MKKTIPFIGLLFAVALFFPISSQAIILEESARSDEQVVYDVLTDGPNDSVAVQLRLEATQGEIINYEDASDDSFLVIPTCKKLDGTKEYFTSNTVCVDYARTSGVLEEETVLGRLTVKKDTKLVKSQDNGYLLSNNDFSTDTSAFAGMEDANSGINRVLSEEEESSRKSLYMILLLILGGVTVGVIWMDKNRTKKAKNTSNKAK